MAVAIPRRRGVIPAAEFGQISEAAELLSSAKRVVAEAQAEAETIRESARQEGFARGREEALREAFERVGLAAASVERRLLDQEERIERVVISAVELIIGSLDEDERVRRILRNAIAEVADAGPVSLHVSAEEAELVRKATDALAYQFEIRIDPLLAPGEIVLETAAGRTHIGPHEQITAFSEEVSRG